MSNALTSIPNFRDVGGLRTADGSVVRTGLLYRSVALDTATDDDLHTLAELGIRTIFDLRTALERERSPDRLPDGARHVALDLLTDSGEADPAALFALMDDPPRASAQLADGATHRFYLATYHDLVRLPSARWGYRRLFRSLADRTTGAALVHCTTGKDRTGWAAAALLLYLGVPEDDVLDDYLASGQHVRRAFAHVVDEFVARGGRRDVIEPLMSVEPAFLEAALSAMRADYGSVEDYFSRGLELDAVTLGRLRRTFRS